MTATITHGTNANCPSVQTGTHTHCPGHPDPEPRSGGPMAATVDRVIRRCANHGPQIQEWSFTEFDAAIHRAAESAAYECSGITFVDARTSIIERHVRQELGL